MTHIWKIYGSRLAVGCDGPAGRRVLKLCAPLGHTSALGNVDPDLIRFPALETTVAVKKVGMDAQSGERVTGLLHAKGLSAANQHQAWRITSAVRVGVRRHRTTESDARHKSTMRL